MKTWRVVLVAVMLAAVAFAGCEPRRVVIRQYESGPPPPPARVYVPAPVYAPPPAPVYVPAPAAAPLPPAQVDVEVLTRGPMHEAFGEPIVYAAQAALVITRAPPPPIQEVPPDERPADPRVMWVPGYWTWDDDRADFVWVSGCWRFPPPGYSWVPGYWAQVAAGFQWVPGFWLASPAQSIVYLAPPPTSLEAGPPGPPPGDTFIWVPGYYFWTGYQYVWQPGQFAIAQAGWAWIPPHYVYSPRGCIFIAGYWDYPLERRGILFAPAWFGRGVYLRPGFRYSPVVIIDSNVLLINLFVRPRYSHYYFGDYYDVRYAGLGFHAWFESHEQHRWYDPIAAHEEWRRRNDDPLWERRERERFEHLRQDTAARPPHTFAAQQAAVARLPKPERQAAEIARPFSQLVEKPPAQMRFEKVGEPERRRIEQQSQEVHKYTETRAKWEAPPGAKPGTARAPVRMPTTTGAAPAAVTPPAARVTAPAATVAPPRDVRQPAEVKPPPKEIRKPEEVRAPLPPATAPSVVTPPKEIRKPEEVRVPTPPAVTPAAPPATVRRPEAVRAPTAPSAPIAPPKEIKKPEEVRRPPTPERVNIPKPPLPAKPPEIREPLPPRPEPPKIVAPVQPRVETPRAEPPRTIAPIQPRIETPRPEPPRTIAPAPAPPKVEQPEPGKGKDEKDKEKR